ncbi:MAG: ATP-binding protein [Acidobacteriota bacterium]|nr:ATP-binding protein [Acidobacteriota bacterium]
MKFFNTAGPVMFEDHYSLDPLGRIDLDELMFLIQQKKYFVLHAPRQTGKTSMLLALMRKLNNEGNYRCLYVNVEAAQADRENVGSAMRTILSMIGKHAKMFLDDDYPEKHRAEIHQTEGPGSSLYTALSSWAEKSSKPIVLLIDEIDSLVGDTLISVLRQLRTGYAVRPDSFPQSIILCGVRDVRDYRIQASSEKDPVTGGSAFNVKAASLRLGNFNEAETHALLQQHTDETGQVFSPEAKAAIWGNTLGQPWLVNALAHEVTFAMKANRDRTVTITADMIIQAGESLIHRRETHLDQLADKLREPRVHRVIAPILAGDPQSTNLRDDDIAYVHDLGLIEAKPQIAIANPIYREVIPRMLTWPIQVSLSQETQWYVSAETGMLDMAKLLTAFQQFFRENSEHWTERFQYKEAGAQLLLQAFLQRVVNSGGRIEREYGLGRGRTDLLVIFNHAEGTQKIVLELKLQRGNRQATIEKSLPQITGYMDRCGTEEGHLILFDRSDRNWDEKIFKAETTFKGVAVQTWGM